MHVNKYGLLLLSLSLTIGTSQAGGVLKNPKPNPKPPVVIHKPCPPPKKPPVKPDPPTKPPKPEPPKPEKPEPPKKPEKPEKPKPTKPEEPKTTPQSTTNNTAKDCSGGHCKLPQAFQIWETVTLEKDFGKDDKGVLFLEVQNRNTVSEQYSDKRYLDGHVVEIRPMIGYKIRENIHVHVGYAALLYQQPERFTENDLIQQITFFEDFKGVKVTNRHRLEERFFPGLKESTRYRSLTRLDIPVNKAKTWFIVGSNESFVNLNGFNTYTRPGVDQNRAFVGVNHKFSENLNAEVGYLNQWYMRRSNCDSTMNHGVAITVNKKL